MDLGVASALGAMYQELRRAFKVAGCLDAGHQRHLAGLSPVRDPSEHPHHDLEVGGGIPTRAVVCISTHGHSGPATGAGGKQ